MSYNNNEDIEKWYSDFEIIPLEWKYGMNSSKESNEILIVSKREVKVCMKKIRGRYIPLGKIQTH